jgi:hypothetical protein
MRSGLHLRKVHHTGHDRGWSGYDFHGTCSTEPGPPPSEKLTHTPATGSPAAFRTTAAVAANRTLVMESSRVELPVASIRRESGDLYGTLPSGDHAGRLRFWNCCAGIRTVTPEPSAFMMRNSLAPGPVLGSKVKTILRPSGDHAGPR